MKKAKKTVKRKGPAKLPVSMRYKRPVVMERVEGLKIMNAEPGDILATISESPIAWELFNKLCESMLNFRVSVASHNGMRNIYLKTSLRWEERR